MSSFETATPEPGPKRSMFGLWGGSPAAAGAPPAAAPDLGRAAAREAHLARKEEELVGVVRVWCGVHVLGGWGVGGCVQGIFTCVALLQ